LSAPGARSWVRAGWRCAHVPRRACVGETGFLGGVGLTGKERKNYMPKMLELYKLELQALELKGQMQNVQALEQLPDLIASLYIFLQDVEIRLRMLEPEKEMK